MGCTGCSTDGNGVPKGCGSKGHCTSGRCNKMNTFDWLSQLDIRDPSEFEFLEISFKQGSRKDFYKVNPYADVLTGDLVVVEAANGYDIGRVSLSGELVRLQMKKKRFDEDRVIHKIVRRANDRDLEKLDSARSREHEVMVRARAIARTLDLEMKIGDVEFQGDNRKATFYYTAEGRIDFRELVRHFANEFKVKIEMRQIGSRQESARIGGVGPCGRELCCSTWLSDFKSVTTAAARYQNLAINQTKLSGQCGRLKCCLNYELDSYMSALKEFPKNADTLKTSFHTYQLIKTDIFQGIMYYIQESGAGRGPVIAINKERVREIQDMNAKGEFPDELSGGEYANIGHQEDDLDFEDVTGAIELPADPKKDKRRGRGRANSRNRDRGRDQKRKSSDRGKNEKSRSDNSNPPRQGGTSRSNNKRRK